MHRIFRVKAYEKEHGPHFNEEYARKAVMKMENEDGTRGPHWSLEEITTLASQYGIALGSKFNRYDWFVALNMVYSDYYRVIMNITGSNNTNTQSIIAKLDAIQNQALLDKIDTLREKNSTLISQLSNEHQTAAVGSMINQATAPIVTRLNDLQSDVDGIKCKLPNTVSVPYPQLTAINTDIYRAAAYGAYAGDVAYGRSGYGCGCNNYWG